VAEPSGSPPGLSNHNRKQSITVTPVLEFLTVGTAKKAKLRHRAKFLADRSNRCGDIAIFLFFQDGGRPPSWICDAHVWTTHEGHLVVFITV